MKTGLEPRINEIAEELTRAARFSISPRFSLFRTTSRGEYTLLLQSGSVTETAARFMSECISGDWNSGLELRCDGIRVPV